MAADDKGKADFEHNFSINQIIQVKDMTVTSSVENFNLIFNLAFVKISWKRHKSVCSIKGFLTKQI